MLYVIKRDGTRANVEFDKITTRIKNLMYGLNEDYVDPVAISQKVIEGLYAGVTTSELDEWSANVAVSMISNHQDYSILASRIVVSNLHKSTLNKFSETIAKLYEYHNEKTGKHSPLVSKETYDYVQQNADVLDNAIDYKRDFNYDYFGFKTLQHSYLIKIDGKTVERPQHLLMRVAVGIHIGDTQQIIKAYNDMSNLLYTHATPTLFNAGTPNPQLSSCFLLMAKEDSIDGIYETLSRCAKISKYAGGIGLSIHNIRAADSYISGTGGSSNGIVPMLRVFNNTARYVDQCWERGTPVVVKGKVVPIEDIQPGMEVLTHDGSFQKVKSVLRYKPEIRTMYRIASDLDVVYATDKHQILYVPGGSDSNTLQQRIERGITTPTWTDVECLNKSDYIVSVVPDAEESSGMSIDDLKMYGLMLKLGSFTDMYINVCNNECVGFIEEYFRSNSIHYVVFLQQSKNPKAMPETGSFWYCENGPKDIEFRWFECKKMEQLKNMPSDHIPDQFLNLSCEETAAIIEGYEMVVGTPKSKNMQRTIAYLRYKAYNRKYNQIANIVAVDRSTEVYDLEVENNHTYTIAPLGIVHNGGGKRKGAFAIYLEPWHADIFEFLDLKKNTGVEEERARDLFYAIWMNDLFMKRVEKDEPWSLFCPNEAPGLFDVWGTEFEKLYTRYEKQGIVRKTVKAQDLFRKILISQQETGTPYMLYKDACNRKSNQQNLGTIKSSNLCCEIVEYTAPDEIAVCNLASICLPKFVKNGKFDFEQLEQVSRGVTVNLNKVIDRTFYPLPEAKNSNLRHRPIGIGIQGLADVFMMLKMPYESQQAQELNSHIFETIYYGAVASSVELAKTDGAYATFAGSPASEGILQFDMWDIESKSAFNPRYNWAELKEQVVKHGLRNSLLVAPMPTASTSQIMGNNESFEAYTSNLYVRRTLAGEFTCVNAHLVRDLIELKLWSPELKNAIIAGNGSIRNITKIPQEIREIYKTSWEMSKKKMIDMAAERGRFIDQSQSFNIYLENFDDLSKMHIYGWKKGLKTGMYYLRTRAAMDAIKITVDVNSLKKFKEESDNAKKNIGESCQAGCMSCGS
jgi:ribonucleoside-diphosphate reductase alpha subunit